MFINHSRLKTYHTWAEDPFVTNTLDQCTKIVIDNHKDKPRRCKRETSSKKIGSQTWYDARLLCRRHLHQLAKNYNPVAEKLINKARAEWKKRLRKRNARKS